MPYAIAVNSGMTSVLRLLDSSCVLGMGRYYCYSQLSEQLCSESATAFLTNMKYLLIAVLLSGCAFGPDGRVTGAGSASYEYKRTLADGSSCVLSIVSGRDIMGGELSIGENCQITTKASSTQGVVDSLRLADDSINAIRETVKKLP